MRESRVCAGHHCLELGLRGGSGDECWSFPTTGWNGKTKPPPMVEASCTESTASESRSRHNEQQGDAATPSMETLKLLLNKARRMWRDGELHKAQQAYLVAFSRGEETLFREHPANAAYLSQDEVMQFLHQVRCEYGVLLGLELREEAAAEELFRQTLQLAPLNNVALEGLGDLLVRSSRFEEYEKLYKSLSFVHWREDPTTGTVKVVDTAPHPSHSAPLARLADVELRRGEVDLARIVLQLADKCDPHSVSAKLKLAEAERADGRGQTAVQLYAKALALDPAHPVARLGMAETLEEVGGDAAEAETMYRRACQHQPADVNADTALFLRGIQHARGFSRWPALLQYAVFARRERGDNDMALRMHQRAVELAPDQADALLGLSWFHLEALQDHAAALQYLEKAMEVQPQYHNVHRIRGNILYRQDCADGAAVALGRAVQLHPSDARSLCDLGHVLAVQGRLKEARARFCAAKDADPRRIDADLGLAALYLAAGRTDDAEKFRLRAEALNPGAAPREAIARIALAFRGPQTCESDRAASPPRSSLPLEPDAGRSSSSKQAQPNPVLLAGHAGGRVVMEEDSRESE